MTTATGPLLRSGNIKDYAPLGETGNPAYKWAAQIRVAIKRKVNAESAQVFAIPQPNERGDVIDWYAPDAGLVIPWSSATPEEKQSAKEQLDTIKQQLDIASDESRHSENAEQSVFNRLLKHVLQFPDDEYVYLVNGKPVLTFWGFVKTDATSRPNPLAILAISEAKKTFNAVPPPVSTVEVMPVKRRSFWWWLLPLLLLLLLLLFLLRGCEEPNDIPLFEKLTDNPEPEILLDDKPIPDSTQTVVEREVNTIHDGIVNDTTLQESIINTEEALLELEVPETEVSENQAQDMLPEQPVLEEHLDEELQTTLEPEEMEPANAAPEEPVEQDEQLQDPMSSEENKIPNENPELQPLAIPDESSQQDSMDFLNGRWQANSGLMDEQGRPVDLEYEFNDGKGHVRIKKNDGSICSGAVDAKRNGSELTFSDQEAIKCQNGESYQPAKVKCTINSDKQTVCGGAYSSGDSFNMDINKATETE